MKKLIASVLVVTLLLTTGCTARFKRSMKSAYSNYSGGLDRTVTLYDHVGNKIQEWSGQIDLEQDDQEVWFDLNDKRTIIQGGIVVIQEN